MKRSPVISPLAQSFREVVLSGIILVVLMVAGYSYIWWATGDHVSEADREAIRAQNSGYYSVGSRVTAEATTTLSEEQKQSVADRLSTGNALAPTSDEAFYSIGQAK